LLFMREELGVGAIDASVIDEREVKEGRRLGQWKEPGDVRVEDEKGKGVKALVDFGIGDGAKQWKKRTLDLEIELRAVRSLPLLLFDSRRHFPIACSIGKVY
jgi:hypothetical protein